MEHKLTLSKLTSPTNIKYALRISNNWFCAYFAKTIKSDNMSLTHPYIILWKLSNLAYKLTISNAHIIILHNIIENKLTELRIIYHPLLTS